MDPLTIAAIISGVAGVGSSIFSAKSAEKTNQSNAQQARAEMDFQERMSNTSHQREVADLRAAGLNPILSAHGGASTPGGAMATFQNPNVDLSSNLINSARGASDAIMARSQRAMNVAQVKNLAANSAKTRAETKLISGGSFGFPGGTRIPISSAINSARSTLHNLPQYLDNTRNRIRAGLKLKPIYSTKG